MASAYNAYLKSTDPVERGAALFVIGRDYDRHDKHKEALAAFEAGLAFTQLAGDRRARRGAAPARRLPRHQGRGRRPRPKRRAPACASTRRSRPRATSPTAPLCAASRTLDGIVTARGDTMCLDGMKHGGVYSVEVLAGLPAATGERLRETFTTRVVVPDRKPQIRFSGTGYVLPKRGQRRGCR